MKPTKKRSTSGGTGVDNGWMVSKCQELIRTFNPVTHSVDTHCLEALGDIKSPVSTPYRVAKMIICIILEYIYRM